MSHITLNFLLLFGLSLSLSTIIKAEEANSNASEIHHLTIATIAAEPFVRQNDKTNATEGFIVDILKDLASALHFTYQFTFTERYGRKIDGKWDGLIGEVVEKGADLAAGPLTITLERSQAVDFTVPFMQTGLGVLFKRPRKGEKVPFSTMKEMVANDKYVFGVVKDGSTHKFFQNNTFKLFKEMGDVLRAHPERLVNTVSEGVERVRSNETEEGGKQFALVSENRSFRWFVRQRPCNLLSIPYRLQTINYAFAFPKGSDMVPRVNTELLRMREDGRLHLLEEKWYPDECGKPKLCVCKANKEEGGANNAEAKADSSEEED